MNNLSFLSAIVIISLFLSFFLAVFLFSKPKNKLSNRLFAFYLILTALDASGFLFDSLEGYRYNLVMVRNLLIYLQLPALYLYILSVTYSDFKLKFSHLINSVPFVIINLIFLPRFYLKSSADKTTFLNDFKNLFEAQFSHIFLHLQVALYIFIIFMGLRKARQLYLENYTGNKLKSYHWLYQLTTAITIFYAIALFKNIFKFSDYENISFAIKIGLYFLNFLIICWYLYKALNNPALFQSVDSKLKLVETLVTEENKSLTSTKF